MPIQAVEPGMDPLCEFFQTPDDQMQATVGCLDGSDSIPFGAQMFEPLLQTGHTRPELVGADQLIGVAVNQPIDAALQTRDLSVQRNVSTTLRHPVLAFRLECQACGWVD
jgi:hypothetical protein